jgi:hypothetical protein
VDLGYIREYFDDRKAWDEWPRRVDRLGYYGLRNEQRPYRLEDVLAAHCRQKSSMNISFISWNVATTKYMMNEEQIHSSWGILIFMLAIHCVLYYFQLSLS